MKRLKHAIRTLIAALRRKKQQSFVCSDCCPWCGAPVQCIFEHCPKCGRKLV